MMGDSVLWAWLAPRGTFPKPCDFCGRPIHPEHAYRKERSGLDFQQQVAIYKLRCERCIAELEPAPFLIRWGITRDTPGADTVWIVVSPVCDTLEDAYTYAQSTTGLFDIVKWYITARGRWGSTYYKGFQEHLDPIEVIRERAGE